MLTGVSPILRNLHRWVWINTWIDNFFSGMNIHLPAILMFTRGTRFDTLPYIYINIDIYIERDITSCYPSLSIPWWEFRWEEVDEALDTADWCAAGSFLLPKSEPKKGSFTGANSNDHWVSILYIYGYVFSRFNMFQPSGCGVTLLFKSQFSSWGNEPRGRFFMSYLGREESPGLSMSKAEHIHGHRKKAQTWRFPKMRYPKNHPN